MSSPDNHNLRDFFHTATGHQPYLWQCRLACGEAPDGANCDLEMPDVATKQWLSGGSPCFSRLIDIPTGLGKTAGVILAWLWNRMKKSEVDGKRSEWPRRLVYCLPMRTLVEQTAGEVEKWLSHLQTELQLPGKCPRVVILMGGEDVNPQAKDWDLYLEDPCILIGTQDMLLSRALNRGYGMSRYRWPMHFGLLNNDCLWVMDEVQLMGAGLETSAQLQGIRNTIVPLLDCSTWWMSATVSEKRLHTPDFKKEALRLPLLKLNEAEKRNGQASQRIQAPKSVNFSDLHLSDIKADGIASYAAAVATQVVKIHEKGSLSLVILNRVDRAQAIFNALIKNFCTDIPCALIHSRFRPSDRAEHMKLLSNPGGGILVATQAVEAGLDISARHLFTELAPWSSLVQRMGRCNRDGKAPRGGVIHWIDLKSSDEKKMRDLALPYDAGDLNQARVTLTKVTSASISDLYAHSASEPLKIRPILRIKDLLDLFDTSPDLAGLDLDISRYIRDGNDTDVEVFWRDIPKDQAPSAETAQPINKEICRVSIAAFRAFLKKDKSKRIWRWQGLNGQWEQVNDKCVYPGVTCLIASDAGGYTHDLGWTGNPKDSVKAIKIEEAPGPFERYSDNSTSQLTIAETLETHTAKVSLNVRQLADQLIPHSSFKKVLETAARWHDLGKAHYHFQTMLLDGDSQPTNGDAYLAKSIHRNRCRRPFFRHELASALGWLAIAKDLKTPECDLVAYLIASHHGKVRLSIRAMPNEQGPKSEPDRAFARGIWHGDQLPYQGWPLIQLNGEELAPITLDLAPLIIGGKGEQSPSWLERTLQLRDRTDLGPFSLAYLETILRAADGRASMNQIFPTL